MQSSSDQLIATFKALADPVRLRLLALCVRGECSVSELTRVTGQSQPRISQHLKQLCDVGLLQRFRDGHFVFYRVPKRGAGAPMRRRLMALLPADEPTFRHDFEKLSALRTTGSAASSAAADQTLRELHRSLIELTVSTPLGDLIDIGSGQGNVLKLLGSRAQRAVGVDIDSDARQLARAELLIAGIDNCSVRKGDMYELAFADGEFNTVILDDVLGEATRPMAALAEARRLVKSGGRLLVLARTGAGQAGEFNRRLAEWCGVTGLRLASPRHIPQHAPRWVLAVATVADDRSVAA